jgi:transposase
VAVLGDCPSLAAPVAVIGWPTGQDQILLIYCRGSPLWCRPRFRNISVLVLMRCVVVVMLRVRPVPSLSVSAGRRMEVVMSVRPGEWPEVPEATAAVARASFPKGSLAMRLRDGLGPWYEDADFAGLYAEGPGRPGLSPAQLMTVTVLQFTEDLTDRQAADAVRGRIDWKYCLGLDLGDSGFDFSVLSGFRARLLDNDAGRAPLDVMLARLRDAGLVLPGGRQRTDSTHILARVRDLNRLELAGEAVRAALEDLARAEPGWLAGIIDASWQDTYGRPVCELRLPKTDAARARLAGQFARDGYHLLEQARKAGAPPSARDLPGMRALRVILLQQFCRCDGPDGHREVTWRDPREHGLPPGRDKIISPYDPDARYAEKRDTRWNGYKAHYTETIPDRPPGGGMPARSSLITSTQTTHAAVPDVMLTQVIHDGLDQAGILPGEHVTDSGYASAGHLTAARGRGVTLLTPLLPDPSWQAREGGITAASFTIDWDNRTAACPQGAASTGWSPAAGKNGEDVIIIRFPARTCRACPVRDTCTRSARSGRTLTIRPRETSQAVAAARAEQDTSQWKARYAARAGVEGLMKQATHVTGIRRARYLGLPKTALEHAIAAAALNLLRLDAWQTATPPDHGHPTRLQQLNLAA